MPWTSPSTSRSSRRCAASATACGHEPMIRLSLRVRLSLAFAIGAALLVAIGVAVVSSVLTRSVDDAIDSELRSRLADVSAAASERADAVVHADQFAQVIAADGSVLVDSSFGARGPV